MGRRVDDFAEFTAAIGAVIVPDTSFRTWMNRLAADKGARSEWPLLLSWMLESEYERQRQIDHPYTGPRILIDRTCHDYDVKMPEKRAMYGLYHRCLQETKGCLRIGDMPVWLLSYEMPNQADEAGRRADLVGLTQEGGLVVFEGKLGQNSYPPISAILEGLDYLSCLTSTRTFDRLISEFAELKPSLPVPEGFEGVGPERSAQPTVIVLADSVYFDFYDRSKRGPGWREMLRYCHRKMETPISIRFAMAKLDVDRFFAPEVSWLD